MKRGAVAAVILLAVVGPAVTGDSASSRAEIVVYAAASLSDVLQQAAPTAEQAIGAHLVFNFGASNDLAHQIRAGRKADLFISADEAWMDDIAAAGLVDTSSRRSFLSNRLVVIGRAGGTLRVTAAADLTSSAMRRLSIANPDAVPAGKYAKGWLESAGIWAEVADRIAPAIDDPAALAAVASGGADAGIVYRTDAAMSHQVSVLFEVPEKEGPKISYVVAAMTGRPDIDAARRAAAWMAGAEAAAFFERAGFVVPSPAASVDLGLGKASPPMVSSVGPPASAAPAGDEFTTKITPILKAKCSPCHFEGGKMYAKLPFDQAMTLRMLGEKLFTRITDEGDRRIFRAFLARQ